MTALMELRGVSVALGGKPIVREVALAINAGEVVALIGPNGAGKSTLLKVMAGLLAPSQGDVLIEGRATRDLGSFARARIVAYLPQNRVVHWPMPVHAIVALGRLPHKAAGMTSKAQDAAAVDAAMAATHVDHLALRPILELSGGEQARALLARALAQEPRLLIADEPTAGLDLAHQLDLAAILRRRATDHGAALVALHDLGLAARVADRIVLMQHGRIVATGPPAEVLTERRIAEVYGVDMVVTQIEGIPTFVPRGPASAPLRAPS